MACSVGVRPGAADATTKFRARLFAHFRMKTSLVANSSETYTEQEISVPPESNGVWTVQVERTGWSLYFD